MIAAANIAVAAAFLLLLLAQPIVIDDHHFDDLILLANVGWRGVNGFVANIDYPHFYGGLDAQFVTLAFQLFGVDFLSIHYAFAMMFVWATGTMVLLGLGRLPFLSLSILVALSGALILSLSPIENGLITAPRSAHSFVYNHVAIVLMMGLAIHAMLPLSARRLEGAASLLAGITAVMLVLLKATFGIFLPFILLALLLQKRWQATALFLIGGAIALLVMDPGATRILNSLQVLLASDAARANANVGATLWRSMNNVSAQFFVILLLCLVLFELWRQDWRYASQIAATSILCVGGFLGALISMGGTGGYMLLPILVAVSAVLVAASSRVQGVQAKQAVQQGGNIYLHAIPFLLCYSLTLPALLSAAGTFVDSWIYRNASLITSGPAASYVVKGSSTSPTPDLERALQLARTSVEEDISRKGLPFDDSVEYVMFADGIALLQSIPSVQDRGIVADGRMFDFSAAIGSRPVLSFPVWPTQGLAYFQSDAPLMADVDLVMISTGAPSLQLVGSGLKRRMGDDFIACRQSAFWTVYARDEACHPGKKGRIAGSKFGH